MATRLKRYWTTKFTPSTSSRWQVPLLLVLALLWACSDDPAAGDDSCADDERLIDGECTNIRDQQDATIDDANDLETNMSDLSPDVPDDTSADAGGDVDEDLPPECQPNETVCFSADTRAFCEAGVFEYEDCADTQTCELGDCVDLPTICEPGENPGCADDTHILECNDAGSAFDSVECPDETPNCVAGLGVCSTQVCVPDDLQCGDATDDVDICSADGSGWEFDHNCPLGTLCDRGDCLSPCEANAKDPSFLGCDYWALDLDNLEVRCDLFGGCDEGETCDEDANICEPSAASLTFAVSVSNPHDQEVNVTITNIATSAEQTLVVAAETSVSVPLDRLDVNGTGVSRNAYRISADLPVTAHQFNPANNVAAFSNDASLLLPSNVAGETYVVMTWPTGPYGTLGFDIGSPENQGAFGYASVVAVSNTEEPTEVTITPSVDVAAGPGVPAIAAGSSETITLAYGDVLNLQTASEEGLDLSGTFITSTRPVLVHAGHECAFVPDDPLELYCDHVEQQLFPVEAWGSRYFAAKFAPRGTEDDVWRVVAANDGTLLRTDPDINGVNGVSLDAGELLEFLTDTSFEIESSAPISVAHFMVGSDYPGIDASCPGNFGPCDDGSCEGDFTCDPVFGFCVRSCTRNNECRRGGLGGFQLSCNDGGFCARGGVGDPAFTMSVPVNQYRDDYVFLVPGGFSNDWISVVAPDGAEISFDGDPLPSADFVAIGATGYSVLHYSPNDNGDEPLPHVITGTEPFALEVHGYDCDVSYAYPGGLNLSTD